MKNILVILSILVSFVITACNDAGSEHIKAIPLGKTLSSTIVVGRYPNNNKTLVQTEKSNIVLFGTHSIDIGVNTNIQVYANGNKFLCQDTKKYCWRIEE